MKKPLKKVVTDKKFCSITLRLWEEVSPGMLSNARFNVWESAQTDFDSIQFLVPARSWKKLLSSTDFFGMDINGEQPLDLSVMDVEWMLDKPMNFSLGKLLTVNKPNPIQAVLTLLLKLGLVYSISSSWAKRDSDGNWVPSKSRSHGHRALSEFLKLTNA